MKTIIKKYERQIKTFIEVFFSYIAINIISTDITNKTALYALLAGAIGSAISGVINFRKGD